MKTHPCQTCGACCAFFQVSFHWSESLIESYSVPLALTVQVSPHLNAMTGTTLKNPRCTSFKGVIGKSVSCEIYENRPSSCRSFRPSFEDGTRNERCEEARTNKGLPLLTLSNWEKQLDKGLPVAK